MPKRWATEYNSSFSDWTDDLPLNVAVPSALEDLSDQESHLSEEILHFDLSPIEAVREIPAAGISSSPSRPATPMEPLTPDWKAKRHYSQKKDALTTQTEDLERDLIKSFQRLTQMKKDFTLTKKKNHGDTTYSSTYNMDALSEDSRKRRQRTYSASSSSGWGGRSVVSRAAWE